MNGRCMTPRERALYDVQTHAFAAKEIQLFLDTHPDNGEAAETLARETRLEREATRAYEEAYGPITLSAAVRTGRYLWTEGPWPWEKEA
ncbi:MAG: spore coat protein CotJB [Clostridia bacterium]|nr:spore coat protein CotJB [Clostridia bacterium]